MKVPRLTESPDWMPERRVQRVFPVHPPVAQTTFIQAGVMPAAICVLHFFRFFFVAVVCQSYRVGGL